MVGAVSTDVTKGGVLAIINVPAVSVKATFARAIVVARVVDTSMEVTLARVLAIVRGRVQSPFTHTWTFSLDGHDFYVLNLPTDETLVCDLATNEWFIWGTGDTAQWRANIGITWNRLLPTAHTYGSNVLVGDNTTGALYFLDPEGVQDDSNDTTRPDPVPFTRTVYGQVVHRSRDAAPCYGVRVFGSLGKIDSASLTAVTLYSSDDGGETFTSHGAATVVSGSYNQRLEWPSLGQIGAPGRLFKLVDTGALIRIDDMEMDDAAEI